MPSYPNVFYPRPATKKVWRYPGVPIPHRLRGAYQDVSRLTRSHVNK